MFHLDNRLIIQLKLLNISLEMIPLFSSFFYMPIVHLCLKSTDFNASYLLNSSSSSISTTTLISDPHNFLVGLSWHSPDWSACPILLAAVLCWVTLSCPTLCDPMDGSPPGSPDHVILQARILEWVAMPSTRGSSQPRDQTQVSLIAGRFFAMRAIKTTIKLFHSHALKSCNDFLLPVSYLTSLSVKWGW